MSVEFTHYNDDESMTHFMRRVEDLNCNHKSTKYTVILEFLNKSMITKKGNYNTLTDFKSVSHKDLVKNESHFKKSLNKYNNKLANDLNLNPIELMNIFTDDDSDDNNNNNNNNNNNDINDINMKVEELYIISYLQRLLDVIDYTIISKLCDGTIYYSIKNKQRKTKIKIKYDESELIKKFGIKI